MSCFVLLKLLSPRCRLITSIGDERADYSAIKYLVLCGVCSFMCNVYPLTPHFYIVKVGFTGVYFIFFFCSKNRLWVLVRTASLRRF